MALLRSLSLDEKQCCNLEVDEAPAGDRKQGLEEEKAAVKGFLEEEAPAESCAEEKAVPPEEEEEEVSDELLPEEQEEERGVWQQQPRPQQSRPLALPLAWLWGTAGCLRCASKWGPHPCCQAQAHSRRKQPSQ